IAPPSEIVPPHGKPRGVSRLALTRAVMPQCAALIALYGSWVHRDSMRPFGICRLVVLQLNDRGFGRRLP
ncbi:MAG TPA: hypothetical protein VKP67_15120, partial [Xanthobacteraceae bacterium]|nr:hypothetical protein [Xanthobacteraceae bacterium]